MSGASRGFTLPTGNTPTGTANLFGGTGTTPGTTQPAPATTFSLGAGDPGAAVASTQPSLFTLGSAPKLSSAPAPATPATTANIPTAAVASQPGTPFSFGDTAKFSLPTTSTFSSTTSTPSTVATTTSAPSFGLGTSFSVNTTANVTSATTFGGSTLSFTQPVANTTFTAAAVTSTPSLATATTGQPTLGTSTTVTDSSAVSASSINFCQLEEAINKWTLELEEQEKSFMNQVLQVNSWDRLLIANGEKIINLNDSVEQVKLEQKQLEHELDFILAQQRELEDLLTPLEKELETNGVSDPERESTYKLAEDIDIQLKQMSEDLKDIVEHINETNRTQDNTDPIVQISRILNAHMNSLQWIDQNTTIIASHLEQVSKLQEVHRRETERSFHRTYD